MSNTPNPPSNAAKANIPTPVFAPAHVDTSALAKVVAKVSSTQAPQALDTIPSNWDIVLTDDPEAILATSRISGKTFEGTRKDFSKFLRGELEVKQE